MVEVEFEGVWVRVARDGLGLRLAEPAAEVFRDPLHVVVLGELHRRRALPIWMGRPDAYALLRHHRGMSDGRPVAASVMAALLNAGGASVDHVAINRFQANVYSAAIHVAVEGGTAAVEARASDALNLGVRVGAPMLVAEEVMNEMAFPRDELPERLEALQGAGLDTPLPPGDWRPLSTELISELRKATA